MAEVIDVNANQISHAIVFSGGLGPPQTTALRNQLAFLNQPAQQGITHLPATRLLLLFSCWGGSTFEMRSLYDLMRSVSYPIEIHAIGAVKSAAVPLILAAERRTAAPGTTFFFHPWTWSTEVHPGHTTEGLEQFPIQLKDDIAWARKTLEQRSKLNGGTIDRLNLFDRPRIEGTDFALDHGLIHEVTERKIPSGVMTWNIG